MAFPRSKNIRIYQSFNRISTISSNVVKSTFKQVYSYLLLLFFALLIWFSPDCSLFAFGDELRLATETCFSTILLGSLTLSLLACCGSIQEEIESKTLLTLISKPMSRHEFVLGKFLGAVIISLISTLFLVAIFCVMAKTRVLETATQSDLKILITSDQGLGVFLLFLESIVVLAFSIMIAPFFNLQLNFCLSIAFMVICNISHLAEAIFATGDGILNFIFHGIFYFIPDFTIYNLGDLLAKGFVVPNLLVYTATAFLYTVCFLSVILSVAILIFSRKEI